MGSFLPGPSDSGPDVEPVTTPDQKERAKLAAAGLKDSNIVLYWLKLLVSCFAEVLKLMITLLAGAFDEILSLIVPFVTAGQGIGTGGFYDLVAAILSDLLGVEVTSESLQVAHDKRGMVGAMQAAGGDFFNVLANELLGKSQNSEAGAGIGGLPGTQGTPLTPEQGVEAAKAFLGFVLSFSVRQGNVAVMTDALSLHLLGQIREYGEQMASNLGLSRLARMAMKPFMTTLVASPLQQALNKQYRPHQMDAKQIASAFIRDTEGKFDIKGRLALQGYSDSDIDLLIADTYNRIPLNDAFLLHENHVINDDQLNKHVASLGFNPAEIGWMIQARQYAAVSGADRKYAEILALELLDGTISELDYNTKFDALRIPKLEADALSRNAVAAHHAHKKKLSLGFLKKAYLDASITLDEYLAHVKELGYDQSDVDILEVELLFAQKADAAKKATKAAAAAKKAAGKTPTVPPKP